MQLAAASPLHPRIYRVLLSEAGLSLTGYSVRRLHQGDAAEFQSLFERCSDYVQLHSGAPPRPNEAEEELRARPAGKELTDKFSFGIFDSQQEMVGFIDLMRNYPAVNEWWIGLLLINPIARGQGLGTRAYRASTEWVRNQQGHRMWLGVLEENESALRFWSRLGFEEVRRESHMADSGKTHVVVVLHHQLHAHAAV